MQFLVERAKILFIFTYYNNTVLIEKRQTKNSRSNLLRKFQLNREQNHYGNPNKITIFSWKNTAIENCLSSEANTISPTLHLARIAETHNFRLRIDLIKKST